MPTHYKQQVNASNYEIKLLNDNFITIIKIINISKITSYKILGTILLSLLICLKSYAVKSYEISNIRDNNLNNQFTQELLLAEFALNNNNPLKALEIYQKIALKTNNMQIAKRATELALENNKELDALKTVAIWASQDKSSPNPLLIASLLFIQHKSIDEASPYLLKLLQFDPKETASYIDLLASHPFEEGKFVALQQHIEKLLTNQQHQNNSNIYLLLSSLYEKNNLGDKSIEYINKAIELTPELQAAHINKIRLLNIYKSTDLAINYLENTVASFPKNYELRKLYADILYDLESWSKAKQHYEILTSSQAYREDALMQLAYIFLTKNELKQAKINLLKLTGSDNYSDTANYYLGLIAQQSGNNQDALHYFNSIEEGEYLIRGKIRIASLFIGEHKEELAKQAITATLNTIKQDDTNTYGDFKEIILSEADLLYQQGLYNDAMIILTNTETLLPEDQDITYSIGILAKKLNNSDLFIKKMEFVIAKEPNNSNALSALGWHYYENNNNQKAFDFLSKAYDFDDSQDSKVGARYAAVLWKMGQKEKADSIWQKAIELDPQNQALRDMIDATKKNN